MPSAQRAALDAATNARPEVAPGVAGLLPAPLVVTLPPSAFADTWSGRPSEPARIGLRLVSELSNDKARANATSSADRFYPLASRDSGNYVDHFNGQLMRGVLAEAVCRPEDVTTSWFKAHAVDQIHIAFHERGIARLWQGYAELLERLSVLLRKATADDLRDLSSRLAATDAMARLQDGDLRLLARILDDLRAQN